MTTTFTEAPEDLAELVDTVSRTRTHVKLRGRNSFAYLISQQEIDGMIATAELSAIPGMVESLKKARNAPREEYVQYKDLNWDAL